MKYIFILIRVGLILFFLVGCGPSAEQISTMTASAWTPTQPPTDTPVPTDTPAPTDTPTPTTPPPFPFRDDFDGKLADSWKWLGEDATHWNLTDTPGFVRIIAQGTNIGGDAEPINFLVHAAPAGNFEIETFVKFEPKTNFQFAGLLVYEGQGKALGYGRAFAQCNFPPCKGNALYFDNPTQQGAPNFVTPIANPSEVYLRIRREGNTYTAFYSEDASNWIQIGQHTSEISPAYVGLIASQAYEEQIPADFDYFSIQALP
jgi:beta-xylosidase